MAQGIITIIIVKNNGAVDDYPQAKLHTDMILIFGMADVTHLKNAVFVSVDSKNHPVHQYVRIFLLL